MLTMNSVHSHVDIEVRHLRLVEAVARAQTVTRAAAILHLSQSAVSHQLIALEHQLGTRLFDRAGRRMTITAAGGLLLETAARVLTELRGVTAALHGGASGATTPLRVATSCYTSYRWLPRALSQFAETHPRVRIDVELAATRRALAALVADEIDLAITTEAAPAPTFASEPLFADDLVALVPLTHRLARAGKKTLAWHELQGECVLTHDMCPSDQKRLHRAIERGRGDANLRIVSLTEAITELVKAGFGVGVLGRWSVADQVRRHELAAIPLRPRANRRFRAVWRRSNARHLPLQELARAIRATATEPQ
jgi:LysR family transcriptional regulator for metE and metH